MSAKEEQRVQVRSNGVGLIFSYRLPSSAQKATSFSTTFHPKLKVSEGGTAANYRSGNLDAASSWSFKIKTEHLLNRRNTFFWSFEHKVEKSIYKGKITGGDDLSNTRS